MFFPAQELPAPEFIDEVFLLVGQAQVGEPDLSFRYAVPAPVQGEFSPVEPSKNRPILKRLVDFQHPPGRLLSVVRRVRYLGMPQMDTRFRQAFQVVCGIVQHPVTFKQVVVFQAAA